MVRNVLKNLGGFLIVMLMSVALFAQAQPAQPQADQAKEPAPADNYSEADRPEDNYLERFHALDVCEKLVAENLERIYTLNVITTNFKGQHSDWETDYQAVYKGYKEAVDLYYRRNVIYARVRFEENKVAINKFYAKIAKTYREDCIAMLSKCADVILEKELGGSGDQKSSPDEAIHRVSPEISKALFVNKMRIRIAYGELDAGDRAIQDGTPNTAIFHLRIAKGYAINILESLDAKNKGTFDVHKADNLNRVLTAKKTTTTGGQTTGN